VTGLNDDDTTDTRALIQTALDLGGHVIIPPTTGRYAIAGALNVTVPGTKITTTGAPLRQATNGQSLFDVTVPDVTIDGVDPVGMITTLDTAGMTAAWEMSITASRWTVLNAYKGVDRFRIPWIRGRGFSSVVRVTNWDKVAGAVAATRVLDTEIGTLLCSNVEFGLVFQGTERLSWDLIKGSYTRPAAPAARTSSDGRRTWLPFLAVAPNVQGGLQRGQLFTAALKLLRLEVAGLTQPSDPIKYAARKPRENDQPQKYC
jgi:hypothetical protein